MKRAGRLIACVWKRELAGTLKFVVIVLVMALAIALAVALACQMCGQ